MGSSDEENERLSHAEFWDERYATAGDQPTHEWFRSFDSLEPFFERHLFQQRAQDSKILHLGSGDSTIPRDLSQKGYSNQLCLDFSPVVVKLMSERHADLAGVEWKLADVRHMSEVLDKSIDVAFDKGTLDAMIHGSPWSPPDDVKENTGAYLKEVFRVLQDEGVFLYVTYRQPHFIKPLLNYEGSGWNIEMELISDGPSSFDYHGFILTKKKDTV